MEEISKISQQVGDDQKFLLQYDKMGPKIDKHASDAKEKLEADVIVLEKSLFSFNQYNLRRGWTFGSIPSWMHMAYTYIPRVKVCENCILVLLTIMNNPSTCVDELLHIFFIT